MAAPRPTPIKLTDEERLRDDRVIECLDRAVGGYHVDSVANYCRCSNAQAGASLRRLTAGGRKDGKVTEEYVSFANTKLWRIKR